jgi:hypothetical protein
LENEKNRKNQIKWSFQGFFFATGVRIHNEIFGTIRQRYSRLFESQRPVKRTVQSNFASFEIGRYIDQINFVNQIICDSKVTEMKALENLSTDEYYQTVSTYFRIIDERNEAFEKIK